MIFYDNDITIEKWMKIPVDIKVLLEKELSIKYDPLLLQLERVTENGITFDKVFRDAYAFEKITCKEVMEKLDELGVSYKALFIDTEYHDVATNTMIEAKRIYLSTLYEKLINHLLKKGKNKEKDQEDEVQEVDEKETLTQKIKNKLSL